MGFMSRIKKILRLPSEQKKAIFTICETFRENGFECFIVGGAVRDLLLGLPVYDVDFTTNARPKDVIRLFRHTVPTGIKHGTITVLIKKVPFEITTYRSEGKYLDGRRPEEVYFSDTLEEDIIRRDFTINGLAYDPLTEELIDLVEGIKDLDRKIIRTIGDSIERLSEDGLRSYRACRFASKLGFEIDAATFEGMKQTLDVSARVSVERIRDEIMKIMTTVKPSVGIDYLQSSGLLKQALPELESAYGFKQNRFHSYDVYYHCVYSCDGAPATDPLIRLAALLHDVGKVPCRGVGADGDYTFYNHEIVGARMVRRIMKRLKFSNDEINRVNNLISNHMFYYTPDWTDGAVRRFIRKVGLENLEDLLVLREADRAGNGSRYGQAQPVFELKKRIGIIIEKDNAFSVRDLNIGGNDLMEHLGIKPGPIFGKILNHLLELVLENPEENTNERLLELAKEYLEQEKTPE